MRKKMWSCMIGEVDGDLLPPGADGPMRDAVAKAYRELTGRDDIFLFSGWGDQLDEPHRAVVEHRTPVYSQADVDDLALRLEMAKKAPRAD